MIRIGARFDHRAVIDDRANCPEPVNGRDTDTLSYAHVLDFPDIDCRNLRIRWLAHT